ncbi:TIGR03862 family flavoprotein [Xenophilus arseniciresistens]|uniref:TIGR03862 family flavoprotein n=1 Tax=Xenophilus arseniciresistens TaxID=1283306 RepID=A0AAE3T0C7_9BURK|nr:TIGR03862 family flavoprotein [Xenophilus arseniciresistens]MDA7416197.1 TIGR03862 family flavoprotein [Xenophilus arseniciresistens]
MKRVAVIGGGPAGLMAAQQMAEAGLAVDLFDAMPSVGRKFLLAGRGGLNLTHSEPFEAFAGRFGARQPQIEPLLRSFDAQALRDWAHALGVQTFIGSSGRVFPTDMKAAPLLRAWLQRLRAASVQFHMRHRWAAWRGAAAGTALQFDTPDGPLAHAADAVVLALGGASWPRLGSDGLWAADLQARGIDLAPLQPANCGFDVAAWTPFFAERFAGQPFKSVAVQVLDEAGGRITRKGEFVATATGVEGSVVYAVSALLRERIRTHGRATLWVDLLPDRSAQQVLAAVQHPRGSRSLGSHLKGRLGLDGIKSALLHELLPREHWQDAPRVAQAIKAAPIELVAPRPVAEAISTAGGVRFEALDAALMLRAVPGVFVAGEMLDWEAPTGGYLLTACMASGVVAAQGVRRWLAGH